LAVFRGIINKWVILEPEPFTKYGPIIYILMIYLFLSNLCLLIFGLAGAKMFCKVVKAPADILAPIIILGTIGAYFGNIRTLFPVTSGQHFGIIRTV